MKTLCQHCKAINPAEAPHCHNCGKRIASGPSDAADCSAFFVGRLAVTDGGPPIDLYECDGSASIERGEDNEVGSGSDLFEAWNDYLYSVSQAPVDEAELAAMWADYDAQNAIGEARASQDSTNQKS